MVEPKKIFGRLGNSMFQYATLIALAKETGNNFYFQDEVWFAKYEEDIKQIFGAGIGSRPEVSIHVRRGDYIDFENVYPDISKTDYYDKAIADFPKDTKFIVFSDDIEWCKTYPSFQGENFSFSEGRSEIHDMNLMASCHHNIIANSTFSWWAAYLNRHHDKKVICPREELWGPSISLPDKWKRV